jgi:membrane protease YdiL (CAAX protease family)
MSRFRFPLLFAGVLAVLLATEALNLPVHDIPLLALPVGLLTAAIALFAYRWLSRRIERRTDVPELARPGAARRLGGGVLLGTGMFSLVMLLIALFGGWDGTDGGSFGGFLITTGVMACVAVNEELLIRGVVVRILSERFGGWVALSVSSLVFGAMHLINEDATIWGAVAIALTGGLLLGAAYLATGSLWLSIGFHFGWNLVQAGVFGVATSGTEQSDSLLHTTLSGATALTGGEFGPEASVLTVVVAAVPIAFLLRHAVRTGRMDRRPTAPVESLAG